MLEQRRLAAAGHTEEKEVAHVFGLSVQIVPEAVPLGLGTVRCGLCHEGRLYEYALHGKMVRSLRAQAVHLAVSVPREEVLQVDVAIIGTELGVDPCDASGSPAFAEFHQMSSPEIVLSVRSGLLVLHGTGPPESMQTVTAIR